MEKAGELHVEEENVSKSEEFLEESVEDLEPEWLEYLDNYQTQADLFQDIFFREFDFYTPLELDDDMELDSGIEEINEDFAKLMGIHDNFSVQDEALLAISIMKRCDVILNEIREAIVNCETSLFPDARRKLISVVSVIRARVFLQNCDEKSLKEAIKTLDLGVLYGNLAAQCDPFCAVTLVVEKLDQVRVSEKDTRTLLRCDGQDGDEVDTDDEERVSRMSTIYNNDIVPDDDVVCKEFPSIEIFYTQYFLKNEPVKLIGCMESWPAMVKWKYLGYLNRLVGARVVPIEMGDYARGGYSRLTTVSAYLEELHAGAPVEKCGYMAQQQLLDQEPRLYRDIVIPDYCALGETPLINVWLGPAGTFSSLHYDQSHNILSQLIGRKIVTLYSQQDTPFLYQRSGKFINNSEVNIKNPDLEAHPEFSKAVPYICLLEPGDQLFIPSGWWHAVESLDVSLSVSFFF